MIESSLLWRAALSPGASEPPAPAGIEYVGGAKVAFNGSTTVGGQLSLTGLTGGIDTQPREGDLVIVLYANPGPADRNVQITTADYIEIADLWADDNTDANLGVFRKFMGASPDTVIDVPATGNAGYGGVVIASVWRGVDPSTPLDVTSTTATGINTGQPTPPAITPATEGAFIVVAGHGSCQDGTGNNAANFTNSDLTAFQTTFSPFCAAGMGYKEWTGGTFTPVIWGGGSANIRSAWAACTIALRPAA